jgi:hypothetical protein
MITISSLTPFQLVDGQTGEIITAYQRKSAHREKYYPPPTPETITNHLAEQGDLIQEAGRSFMLVEIPEPWLDYLATLDSANEDLEPNVWDYEADDHGEDGEGSSIPGGSEEVAR